MRAALLGTADVGQCAICGVTYPVRFLWAAHIKKRSVCSDAERRDLEHIAMPACLFGCDALFETEFISVGDNGRVLATASLPAGLVPRVEPLVGRRCYAHTSPSATYFQWHRTNTFRQSASETIQVAGAATAAVESLRAHLPRA